MYGFSNKNHKTDKSANNDLLFNIWTYGLKIHMTSMMLYVWTMMPNGISPYVQTLTSTT